MFDFLARFRTVTDNCWDFPALVVMVVFFYFTELELSPLGLQLQSETGENADDEGA